MNAGRATLDGYIDALRVLDEHFAESVAKEAAPRVQAALRASAAAGTDPDGTPWADRKEGGQAYANSSSKVTAKALANIVQCGVTGPEVFGQFGAHGMPTRKTIPAVGDDLPPAIVDALTEGARVAFEKITGGK